MVYICSVGKGIPENNLHQEEVKQLVQEVFAKESRKITRLLPIFDHAKIENRQFVVDKNWFKKEHTFEDQNRIYQEKAIHYSLEAIDHCLHHEHFLTREIPYEAIDLIAFVSSTGISTPSIDAFLINERSFRTDIERMPLWGLGCAGGAIGLSKVFDFLKAHPKKSALVVCCELCGITFQKDDKSTSNIVGTALFGDGISACFLAGEASPYLSYARKSVPKIIKNSSLFKKDSTSVMGWRVTNGGLEVIFSKSIPALVNTFWRKHIEQFFEQNDLQTKDISSYIAHPGGMKVLLAMEKVLQDDREKLGHSYEVLKNHGNMSSATVLYVLHDKMKADSQAGEKGILSALGPGFNSEMLLLEWKN